jgi:purine-nucleoside phosphorylase
MIDPHGSTAARAAASSVAGRLGVEAPVCAIVLGSGLAELADRIERATRANYNAIPGFHAPHVEGHRGELIRGFLGGREVLALSGRFHMYEGHDARTSAFPIRVAHALGAKVLFASNAAGGIRRSFNAGDLMIIEDHLNLMFRNPLMGGLEPGDTRFPDMSEPYSRRLIALLEESGRAAGVSLAKGVYAGLLGPSYETPAEVRMLERLGADATGMSTVPETIVAAAMGMEVAAVSLITNPAAGIATAPLSHAEVVEVGARAADRFADLVTAFVQRL